jgi:hypothetical protein
MFHYFLVYDSDDSIIGVKSRRWAYDPTNTDGIRIPPE